MRKRLGKGNLILLLIGMGSMTQVHLGANVGISEAFVFLSAPWIFLNDLRTLRHDGFMATVWLIIATLVSCLVSAWANHIEFARLFRGFSAVYALFAWLVVLHRLLRKNLNGLKWLLLGLALSMTINVFAFQTGQSGDGSINGVYGDAAEITMSNATFWISRIGQWGQLPIKGWYFQTPLIYSIMFPIFMVGYSMLTTESGRSAAVTAMLSAALLAIGQKRVRSMRRIGRHFIMLCVVGLLALILFKDAYRYCAVNGYLGEKSQRKYEQQTKGKKGVLALLMGGRAETFIGFFACLDKPLIGHGPWALDHGHYSEDFLMKYGDDEDYANFMKERLNQERQGRGVGVGVIPGHSHIIGFWLWYGLPGLIFWGYVLYLFVMCLARYMAAIPQWFGYFALSLPSMVWGIFFSPFGSRFADALVIVTVLFARAVAKNRVYLPAEMIAEIAKSEGRA